MKVMHTSDWHIGKIVNEFSMIEDQRYILNQLIEVIKEEQVDVLIIAGDIYDRSIPPTEAVELLDEVLSILVLELRIKVLIISGNHDGSERLGFGNKLLEKQGLYMVTTDSKLYDKVVFEEAGEVVHFYLVPYKDPAVVRKVLEAPAIKTHEDAMQKTIDVMKEELHVDAVNIFVGHGYIIPERVGEDAKDVGVQLADTLEVSESERPLAIGGTDLISATLLEGFDYVALGHLHGHQRVGKETIRYSGTPLKYSFSEVRHKKGVVLFEINDHAVTQIDFKELIPYHQMRLIEGHLEDLLEEGRSLGKEKEDYIQAILLDEGELINPMDRLRAVYKNIMALKRYERTDYQSEEMSATAGYKVKNELELFDEFYQSLGEYELTEAKQEVIKNVIDDVIRKGE